MVTVIDLTYESVDLDFDNQSHINSDGVIAHELDEQINSYEIEFLGIQSPIVARELNARELDEQINSYEIEFLGIMQNTFARSIPRSHHRHRPRAQLRPKVAKTSKKHRVRPFHQDPNAECCICYEKLSQERSTKLKCGHVYHTHCIKKWGLTKMECPMDRKKIRKSDLK